MKKLILLIIPLMLLVGCAAVVTKPEGADMKLGLYVRADGDASRDGRAAAHITMTAVLLDCEDIIRACARDSVNTAIAYDALGTLLPDETVQKQTDSTDAVVGKSLTELADTADPALVRELAAAAEAAVPCDAADTLRLTHITDCSESVSAQADTDGCARTNCNIAAVTLKNNALTGCIFDAVSAEIYFDANGKQGALPTAFRSKNDLGREYGMHAASSIDKDWSEQAAAYAAYRIGKPLVVTEAPDATLSSSVTMSVAGFDALLEQLYAESVGSDL